MASYSFLQLTEGDYMLCKLKADSAFMLCYTPTPVSHFIWVISSSLLIKGGKMVHVLYVLKSASFSTGPLINCVQLDIMIKTITICSSWDLFSWWYFTSVLLGAWCILGQLSKLLMNNAVLGACKRKMFGGQLVSLLQTSTWFIIKVCSW